MRTNRLECLLLLVGVLLHCILLVQCDSEAKRILTSKLNPDCPPNYCGTRDRQNIITVVHIQADGFYDSIHYIWDLTGIPSILMVRTELNTSMSLDWEKFLNDESDCLTFSKKPFYSSTVIINKILFYDDKDDIGHYDSRYENDTISISPHTFLWSRTFLNSSTSQVELRVTANDTNLMGNGHIDLTLKCYGISDHDADFPRLLHSENSTQIDLILNNLTMNGPFNSPRYAFEVVVISDEHLPEEDNVIVTSTKSLDDEYTPGIFQIVMVETPMSNKFATGSFLMYRPVSYLSNVREVTTSTEVIISKPEKILHPLDELNSTMAVSYYGYKLGRILCDKSIISIGLSEDGFYKASNYTTWTFVYAYGQSPRERFSLLVAMVAAISLGLPLMLLVGGGCFLLLRNCRRQESYSAL